MKSARRIGISLVLAVTGFCLSNQAQAQEETLVQAGFSSADGWDYYPAVHNGVLLGYLAKQVAGTPAPDGFTVLWIARDSAGLYTMSGWVGDDLVAAGRKVTSVVGDINLWDHSYLAGSIKIVDESGNTSVPEVTADLVAMAQGLAVGDPFQELVSEFTPGSMENAVSLGAQGAASVSASMIDTEIFAGQSSMFQVGMQVVAGYTEVALTGNSQATGGVSTIFGIFCVPGTVTVSVTTYGPWDPPFPNAGGGCTYTRTSYISTTTCTISITCVLTGCTTTTITGGLNTRVCPSGPNGCATRPPC